MCSSKRDINQNNERVVLHTHGAEGRPFEIEMRTEVRAAANKRKEEKKDAADQSESLRVVAEESEELLSSSGLVKKIRKIVDGAAYNYEEGLLVQRPWGRMQERMDEKICCRDFIDLLTSKKKEVDEQGRRLAEAINFKCGNLEIEDEHKGASETRGHNQGKKGSSSRLGRRRWLLRGGFKT